MPDGIASAASALRYWERRQEVAANNLANANTGGFKAERVFAMLTGDAQVTPAGRTDWTEGTYTATTNPLDLALRGPHFMVVQTPQGERFSRGGSFQVNAQGFLTDANGHQVLGERGPIRVTGHDVTIDRTGRVAVDDVWVDRLRIESFDPGATLTHEAGGLFVPDATRRPVDLDARDVRQRHLEGSNVQPITEMVDMIAIQRNYAFVQKGISTLDDVRATIANQLARPS